MNAAVSLMDGLGLDGDRCIRVIPRHPPFSMKEEALPACKETIVRTGWTHSSQNEIPCVFPEFSLCYINFPCVIFTQKLTIRSMNKGHIATVLLHTEAYKLIFKVWII